MAILFTGDSHLGHKNAIKYDKRPFSSVEEMDETIISNWNNKANSNDTIYMLGDVSWHNDTKTCELLNRMNGAKILIKGNHDRVHGKVRHCFEDIKDYEELHLPGNIHICLFHWPIPTFNRHFYNAYHFYAHVHATEEWIETEIQRRKTEEKGIPCNMYNVGMMHWNYEPVTFEEIITGYPQKIAHIFNNNF